MRALLGGIAAAGMALLFAACGGSKQEAVIAVHIPTAAEVAKQLGCHNYTDWGPSEVGGVTDSGTCWIGKTKYAIDTFGTMAARDSWLDMASSILPVSPKWETSTSVVYRAHNQKPGEF